jgi:hypothetical protein
METKLHPHAAIIDAIPKEAINARFSLSRQLLFHWRRRGVPLSKRALFARLAADFRVGVPQHFFEIETNSVGSHHGDAGGSSVNLPASQHKDEQ